MKTIFRSGVAVAAILLLAGCANDYCRTWNKQKDEQKQWPVRLLEPKLASVIGVQDVSSSRNAAGMATMRVSVCNATSESVTLSIRTRFSGDNGQSEKPSAWRELYLAPNSEATYDETAVSPSTQQVAAEIQAGDDFQPYRFFKK